jgi:hypothetical protein
VAQGGKEHARHILPVLHPNRRNIEIGRDKGEQYLSTVQYSTTKFVSYRKEIPGETAPYRGIWSPVRSRTGKAWGGAAQILGPVVGVDLGIDSGELKGKYQKRCSPMITCISYPY